MLAARVPAGRWRRLVSLLIMATLVIGVTAAFGRDLVQDLVTAALGDRGEQARPLSAAEAQRLAQMRQRNWTDGRSEIRAMIGHQGRVVHAVGWVDWRRPLVYLALSGDRPGAASGLVQAVPGLIATHPGPDQPTAEQDSTSQNSTSQTPTDQTPTSQTPTDQTPTDQTPTDQTPTDQTPTDQAPSGSPRTGPPASGPQPPPVQPPADGWQVRYPGAAGPPGPPAAPGTIDTLVTLLLTTGAETADTAGRLAGSDAQWLRRDQTAGYEVDVLLGPAVLDAAPATDPTSPADPTSLADMGGAVQYWLGGDARLHRLEALLAAETSVRVDFDRADQTRPGVLDVLGGADIAPRPLTDAEVARLSELPLRNQAAGGGELTLRLPEPVAMVHGAGWLDWRLPVAYLASSDGDPGGNTDGDSRGDSRGDTGGDGAPHHAGLVWADADGIAYRTDPAAGGPPPLPAPAGEGWQRSPWHERGDEYGGFDLDLLINEALAMSGDVPIDPSLLRERAAWLRADTIGGEPVDVVELPRGFETDLTPGQARMRYWVDRDGLLRRLEIRTRTGGFAQLDLTPGPVPVLGYAP